MRKETNMSTFLFTLLIHVIYHFLVQNRELCSLSINTSHNTLGVRQLRIVLHKEWNKRQNNCFLKKWKIQKIRKGKRTDRRYRQYRQYQQCRQYEIKSKELKNSEIWRIRREIEKEIEKKNIKQILQERFENINREELNKYNSFSYIYSKEELNEQIEHLCKLFNSLNGKQNDAHRGSDIKLPKLFGLPIAIKDNILTKGIRTTGGSRILSSYKPSYDSTVVSKLKQNGAIIIGKTHMDEFAMGSCTKDVQNPFNENFLSCGGSSGGSGSLVGSRIINCSVGSDTGGSIRTPAAVCGCIGLKPSHGRISRYGLIPYNEETDVVGLIVNNVYDASILLDVLCEEDEQDLTTLQTKNKDKDMTRPREKQNCGNASFRPVSSTSFFERLKQFGRSCEFANNKPLMNFRLCYLSDDLLDSYFVDRIIKDNYKEVIKNVKKLGGTIKSVKLNNLVDICYVYYMYSMVVAVSNISRFDKISYNAFEQCRPYVEGFGKDPVQEGEKIRSATTIAEFRSQLIGEQVLSRIIGGSLLFEYFHKVNIRNVFISVQHQLRKTLKKIFQHADCILLPSYPHSGTLKEGVNGTSVNGSSMNGTNVNGTSMNGTNVNGDLNNVVTNSPRYNFYMKELFSVIASVSGFPSMIIPSGHFTEQLNEPLSFQVVSNQFDELSMLKIALAYKEKMNVNELLAEHLCKRKK